MNEFFRFINFLGRKNMIVFETIFFDEITSSLIIKYLIGSIKNQLYLLNVPREKYAAPPLDRHSVLLGVPVSFEVYLTIDSYNYKSTRDILKIDMSFLTLDIFTNNLTHVLCTHKYNHTF